MGINFPIILLVCTIWIVVVVIKSAAYAIRRDSFSRAERKLRLWALVANVFLIPLPFASILLASAHWPFLARTIFLIVPLLCSGFSALSMVLYARFATSDSERSLLISRGVAGTLTGALWAAASVWPIVANHNPGTHLIVVCSGFLVWAFVDSHFVRKRRALRTKTGTAEDYDNKMGVAQIEIPERPIAPDADPADLRDDCP